MEVIRFSDLHSGSQLLLVLFVSSLAIANHAAATQFLYSVISVGPILQSITTSSYAMNSVTVFPVMMKLLPSYLFNPALIF